MSYDLMVFDSDYAPKERNQFLDWYEEQTEWTEDHEYDDPKVTTAKLQAFYKEFESSFPKDEAADYSIGKHIIYCSFGWSNPDDPYTKMKDIAKKHSVAFFDASGDEGEVWGLDSNGSYVCLHKYES